MTTARIPAVLADGTKITVIKINVPPIGAPHLDGLPTFKMEDGERLVQRKEDTDLTKFITLHTKRAVTLIR